MTDSLFFSSLLLTHVIQFSIVIAVAAVVVRLTGRRWPHFAFLICMMALLKSLMPPVISSPTSLFSLNPSLALSDELHVASLYDKIRQQTPATRNTGAASSLPFCPEAESETVVVPTGSSWMSDGTWVPLIVLLWAAGAAAVLLRAVCRFTRYRQLTTTPRARVPRHVADMISRIGTDLQIRRPIDVVISETNDGPAIIGFHRPVLILPRLLVLHSTERQLRPIIAHELIHARRGDAIWGTLQFCAQVVWWFHPLVWWLGRRASLLCERCCDEEAIAGIRCSAADYAESLVRVLALRNVFRSVPCGNSMHGSDVNVDRLERLMKRCGRFSARTPVANWLLMVGLALLFLPGAAWSRADEPSTDSSPPTLRQRINAALEAEDWATAAQHLRNVVEHNPSDGQAVFMLGYTLHMMGKYDEALEWHRRATEFEKVRPTALYNCACVLALTGKPVEALDWLEKAVDAGFRHQSDIADDPDLSSIQNSDRFQRIRTRAKRTSGNDDRRALDFWVGAWEVVDPDGKLLGINTIQKAENGFLLTETWSSQDGGSGSSVNFFDPADNMWHQIWVDSRGSVIRFAGNVHDGAMVMNGTSVDASGKSRSMRMTLTPQDDKTVRQHLEQSTDGGNTWATVFQGTYQPKPKDDAEASGAVSVSVSGLTEPQ